MDMRFLLLNAPSFHSERIPVSEQQDAGTLRAYYIILSTAFLLERSAIFCKAMPDFIHSMNRLYPTSAHFPRDNESLKHPKIQSC